MLNIVVFSGGRGASSLIRFLTGQPDVNLTCLVNAYDDGKSTGELRNFFGILGPSDIRKVQGDLISSNQSDLLLKTLFDLRIEEDISPDAATQELEQFVSGQCPILFGIDLSGLEHLFFLREALNNFLDVLSFYQLIKKRPFNFSDCSLMNLVYAGLMLGTNGDIEDAAVQVSKRFKTLGNVYPVSNTNLILMALLENGDILHDEASIVEKRASAKIDSLFLVEDYVDPGSISQLNRDEVKTFLKSLHRSPQLSPRAYNAISNADIIVYAAGTQHSSLYPSYLTKGLAQAVADNKFAKKIFITNVGADYETPSYQASDFILGAYRYLKISLQRQEIIQSFFDINLVNLPAANHSSSHIICDFGNLDKTGIPSITDDFESKAYPGTHDAEALWKFISNYY